MEAILELERAIENARKKGFQVAAVISDYSGRHDVWHKPIIAFGESDVTHDHIMLDMIHILTDYWHAITHDCLPKEEIY